MSLASVFSKVARGGFLRENPGYEEELERRRLQRVQEARDAERLQMTREREGLTLEQMRERAKIERARRSEEERINRLREQQLQGEVLSMPTPEEARQAREADIAERQGRADYYKAGGSRRVDPVIGPTVTLYDDAGNPVVIDRKTGQIIGKGKPPSEPAVQAVPRSEYEGAWQRAKKRASNETSKSIFGFTTRDGLTEGSPEYNDRMKELLVEELRNAGWSDESIKKSGILLGSREQPIKLD